MITIKIDGEETIRLETEIGIFYLRQRMIEVNKNGLAFRTVLDVEYNDHVSAYEYKSKHATRYTKT
jgi:hypothetical protein